jgi:flagellar basal body-associated protein FliL
VPAAPATQPSYAQPTPPADTPPKKRRGWIIALVVGLLLLCGLVACATVFLASGSSGDKAKVTQSETHYTAAETALASAESALESATAAGNGDQMTVAITVATKSVRTSRDEIASAKASAEQLKDSAGKTDYLASLAAATAALDGLENLVAYLDTASGMVSKSNEAGTITKQANSDLDEAVTLGNKGSYARMRSKAAAAAAGYAKATFLFEEADKLDPTAELAKAATYARKRKEQADVVVRMADSGKAGRLSAYNADIKKQAALGKAAMAAGLPAILTDPNWAKNRLAALGKTIMADAEKADTLRKKALGELGYTK